MTEQNKTEKETTAILKDFDNGNIDEDDVMRLIKQEVGYDV